MTKLVIILVAALSVVACGDDAPPPPVPNGEACEVDDGCESGLCVTEFEDKVVVLNGMCTAPCSFDDMGAACADGEVCLRYNATGESYCFQQCSTDEDCREGWSCFNLITDRACIPPL